MRSILRLSQVPALAGGIALLIGGGTARAQVDPTVDAGYLDYFELTDGRNIDVGALGGGIEGQPGTTKISVQAQATNPSPPLPSDGRLTGTVHGKFRVVNLTDRDGNGFINGSDLDMIYDVSWQVVGFDKDLGPGSAFFVTDDAVGPEGTVSPWGGGSVNIPPLAGGTASVFNIAACDATGLIYGGGTNFCNPFAIPSALGPVTAFIDYTFPVSIPGVNDNTPGLAISDINWIVTALLGRTSQAPGGSVTYGLSSAFDPQLGVTESVDDLFGPSVLLNFPGESANISIASLLTTVQINVVPEPATMALLGLGLLGVANRRRAR